eukprot:362032_1
MSAFSAMINGCPFCNTKRSRLALPLSTTHPHLARMYHKRNPISVTKIQSTTVPTYPKSVLWWQCERQNDHVFRRTMKEHVRKQTCPLCPPNTPFDEDIVRSWHTELNGGPPQPCDLEVWTERAGKAKWWTCGVCGHVWSTSVSNRLYTLNAQCSRCRRDERIASMVSKSVLNREGADTEDAPTGTCIDSAVP